MQSTSQDPAASRFPFGIVAVAATIALIGTLNLYSAARETIPDLYLKQLSWLGLAFVAGAIVVRLRTQTLELMAYPSYVVVNFLLFLVLAIGTPIKGAQRWLDLGPMNLQPSELAKITMILVCAKYFGEYQVTGGYTLRKLLRPLNASRPLGVLALVAWRAFAPSEEPDPPWLLVAGAVVGLGWLALSILDVTRTGFNHRKLIAPMDVVALPYALVLVEPDLGTASICLAIAGTMILFCGVQWKSLLIAGTIGIGLVVVGWNFVFHDYQKKRVETFLNPEADVQGAGYHAAQSIIAIGSGQVTGKGSGGGTQTQLSFLPENHTDFAFSVFAEEWGFVGATVIILLFALLIGLMLRASAKATDRFSALVAVGAASMLFWHVFINIGMVTAVLPVVGVPLPLFSYGGSSMLTQITAIALAASAQYHRRTV